ncbi:SRPBCC domain-containing protein [Roseibium sp. AS2]|uniref:SRPBCC family protein n=1 Tax=Roseibium sp. AS2 TaxID=3135781 RepID=UPI00317A4676
MRRPDLTERQDAMEVVQDVAIAPEAVYDAFIGPRLEDWFAARGTLNMRPEPGTPFYFETEFENSRHPHYGRILDLVPGRHIEMTWVTEAGTRGAETVLTISLEPIEAGTRVTLRQQGFLDTETSQRHQEAWPRVLKQMETMLGG